MLRVVLRKVFRSKQMLFLIAKKYNSWRSQRTLRNTPKGPNWNLIKKLAIYSCQDFRILWTSDCYRTLIFPFSDERYLLFLSLSHQCGLGKWRTDNLNLKFAGLWIEKAHSQGTSSALGPNLGKKIPTYDLRPMS